MAQGGLYYARQMQLAALRGDGESLAQLRTAALHDAVSLHDAHTNLFNSVTGFEQVCLRRRLTLWLDASLTCVRVQAVWHGARVPLRMYLSNKLGAMHYVTDNMTLWDAGNFFRSEVGCSYCWAECAVVVLSVGSSPFCRQLATWAATNTTHLRSLELIHDRHYRFLFDNSVTTVSCQRLRPNRRRTNLCFPDVAWF